MIDFINSAYRRFYQSHKKEINKAVLGCLSRGDLTLRKDVWDLEKNIAHFVRTKYCVGVGSGTDALFLSLKALGIGKGDEAITVSNTFVATLQVIIHCGATPVLVDVTEDELMDVSQIESLITPKTKVIIPVQYTGMICDMVKIQEIATKYNLHIVDDYCQALGAKKCGTYGILNAVSFNTAKLLGGLCDGGAVTTDSRELYEKICLLRNHWNAHQLSVDRNDYPQPDKMEWAWKSRLSNVNAAFLNVKFKTIKRILKRREQIALRYNQAFKNLPFGLPHEQEGRIWQEYHLRIPTEGFISRPSYLSTFISREQFAEYLKRKGIETLIRDSVPNHKMEGLGLSHWNLPITERLAQEVIRLPLHEWLKNSEVNYIINAVKSFF